jgi:hypothetical protein
VNLQQRAHELHELIASPSLLHAVLPLGNASAEIKIDESLPALQSYVEMALANGAKPFQSQTELDSFKSAHTDDTHESSYKRKSVKGLKFDAYENVTTLPEYNETKEVVNVPVMDAAKVTNATKGGLQLNNAASVWGPVVTKAPEPAPVAQVQAPEPVYTPTPVVAVSTPTVRTVAAVAAPRELTEKEKMAQSLFMGVTTTTKPRRGRRKVGQTASRTTPAAVKATPQPMAVTKSDDLFDMNFAATSPTPTTTTTTTTASTDLASDIFSATPTTTAPAPSGGNDLDFFGMMTESTPATTTAAPVDDLDIFGMSSAPVAAAAVLVGEAAVSTELKNKLGALPRSDEQVFVDTDKLHVSGFTVFSPAATMMVLCVTNKSATAFGPNANAKLAFGPSFKVNVEFGESKLSSKLGTLTLFLSRLGAGQTKNPVIGLQCIDTKLIPKSVSGQITAFSQTSKFMMPLAASDLLRPLVITTPVFGSTWKKLSKAYEVKISVASSVTTGAEFMRRMSEVIQLHPLQTIKTENICAGMVIGYKQGVVLVHGKMQTTGKIIVLIRSMNLNFNKLLAGKIQATIA